MSEINLTEEMNAKIADILALGGEPCDLYASAYIKDLQAENARLNARIECLSTELAHHINAAEIVFYREQNLKLHTDEIKKQAVEEFVEALRKRYSGTELLFRHVDKMKEEFCGDEK